MNHPSSIRARRRRLAALFVAALALLGAAAVVPDGRNWGSITEGRNWG